MANGTGDGARRLCIGAAALVIAATSAAAANEADATAILKRMGDYLAAQQTIELTFDSDIEVITPEMEKMGGRRVM